MNGLRQVDYWTTQFKSSGRTSPFLIWFVLCATFGPHQVINFWLPSDMAENDTQFKVGWAISIDYGSDIASGWMNLRNKSTICTLFSSFLQTSLPASSDVTGGCKSFYRIWEVEKEENKVKQNKTVHFQLMELESDVVPKSIFTARWRTTGKT